ncbi:MAG: CBS domain-containing protein [Dissulfurispiraceae bacterium]|jgi:CBS-domain-containing membrane protein|nr:CBS domain-containing protein [Dissulfurispiraceae bacterium]
MLKASDIMTKDVIVVKSSTTVNDFANILINNKISGAPVVDDNGNIMGIVTENDLIEQNKRFHIPTVIRIFDAFITLNQPAVEQQIKKMTAATVADICSHEIISVGEDAPLDEIASIMSEKKVHHIPVVKDKKIVGIIGKIDIIKGISS